MRETADDLAAPQAFLDVSADAAGPHLRSIITPSGASMRGRRASASPA